MHAESAQDIEEKAEGAKLPPAKDPVQEEIYAFRVETRQFYNDRNYEALETRASPLRAGKELFRDGSWKIAQFYDALECDDEAPESTWELHSFIHQEWVAAYPESITPRVAQADFLVSYAWHARGSDYADKVTEQEWKLFGLRLAAARSVLENARKLPEKDPVWWRVGLRVALGQGWPKEAYDYLTDEAVKFEPKFWAYQTTRAYSLLPRWHGEPGDWERYADREAARPDGLGAEIYARIVMNLQGFHHNIFQEAHASWPKTREGLEILRNKYPDSLDFLSQSALLASTAQDRTTASQLFKELDGRYLPSAWRRPERYVHARHWAETGVW